MNRGIAGPLRQAMPSLSLRRLLSLAPLAAAALPFALLTSAGLVTGQVVVQRQAPIAAAANVTPRPVLCIASSNGARAALAKTEPAAAAAILRGIEWLLAHQDKDGRWDADEFVAHDGKEPSGGLGNPTQDVALTGLALLTVAREGTTTAKDAHHEPLLRGAHWLVLQQQDNGLLGTNAAHDFVYGHAIGTLGLCAVAAATGSEEARIAAGRGLQYLAHHRNPYAVWRYQPRDNDNDTSVTTWALMANLAGHEVGLPIDDAALKLASTWFDAVTDANGRAGYTKAGEPSSRDVRNASLFPPTHGEAMTAAALWCRQALGQTVAASPRLAAGTALVTAKPPMWQPRDGKVDHCYWFFGSEAMRRVGGEPASTWRGHLVSAVLQGQRTDGTAAGSWDPVDPWGEHGGRLYATTLCVLALQTLYDVPALQAPAASEIR